MKSTFKKMAQRFTSLLLAIALFVPTSSFAQVDTTLLNNRKAKALREAMERIKSQDQSSDIEDMKKTIAYQEVGASMLFGGAAFFFIYNYLANRLDGQHSLTNHYNSQSFGILDWSEAEILQSDTKLKEFLEIRYGEKHPELKTGLYRFKAINRLLDLAEKKIKLEISPGPSIPAVDVTVPEFFKWFLRKIKSKELRFSEDPFIRVLKTLGFAKNPEPYFEPAVFLRLSKFIDEFGEANAKKVVFGDISIHHFSEDILFEKFVKQMKDPSSWGYRLYNDPNPDWAVIHESLQGDPNRHRYNAELLEANAFAAQKRVELAAQSRKSALSSAKVKQVGVALGLALLIGTVVYACIQNQFSELSSAQKYNLSREDMFTMVYEDKETYDMLVDESPQFATDMAGLSDYINASVRKKDADMKFFDDLVAKNKI
jgi:hypothetical protein